MPTPQLHFDEIIKNPTESLNLEIKSWINLDTDEGKAKIVKASLGLRNRNGGYIVIGFDDETLTPQTLDRPADIRSAYHPDKIYELISKYSYTSFDIEVGYGKVDQFEFPIIKIGEGVQYPVSAKRDLLGPTGQKLISVGDVYFRTLNSGGRPSTSKANPADWKDIFEICFSNREADIGSFLRRHIFSGTDNTLLRALKTLSKDVDSDLSLEGLSAEVMEEGRSFYKSNVLETKLTQEEFNVLGFGTFEVAVAISPQKEDAIGDESFLSRALCSNPQYTGWPMWIDSRSFLDKRSAPRYTSKSWQSFVVSLDPSWGWSHVDFWRLNPSGKFYLKRILQDDLSKKTKPGKMLDPILVIIRVAEALLVGLSMAKELGWSDDASLGFTFCWTGLKGRQLEPWANPMVTFSLARTASDDVVTTFVEVPLNVSKSAIPPYVSLATRDLFLVFHGFLMPEVSIEQWVQKLIGREI